MSITIHLYYDLASRQVFTFSLDSIVPHFSWLWTSVLFPCRLASWKTWFQGQFNSIVMSLKFQVYLFPFYHPYHNDFHPQICPLHDYKMAPAAPGITSSHNFVQRQEGVPLLCILSRMRNTFPKTFLETFLWVRSISEANKPEVPILPLFFLLSSQSLILWGNQGISSQEC